MIETVLVGYGMAGARFAEEVRRRDPHGERVSLTVLGEEPQHAYNRILLSDVVAGALPGHRLRLQDERWAAQHAVDLRRGVRVSSVDRVRHRVTTDDGTVLPYDRLVLATGARPVVPDVQGLLTESGALAEGVTTFRTLEDCHRIVALAGRGTPAVVLGGGPLGLEVARGLAGRGCEVTVVHPREHLMERQLDENAARLLRRELESLGIAFRLGAPAAGYLPGAGVKLADGQRVPAELLVISAGVRADTALAAAAGLTVDRGVVVDDELTTSDRDISALGDCAQHPGGGHGLVEPAWQQAAVLADLLTGHEPAARYRGARPVLRLKARGVDLASLGEVHVPVHAQDAEVVRVEDPARGRYAKLVLRDERVAGAILLGSPDAAATITQLYDRGTPAPADRLALLLGRALPAEAQGPEHLPPSAVVCRCNSVDKEQLVTAWRKGARDVEELASTTRATTGCGSCTDNVCRLAEWLERESA